MFLVLEGTRHVGCTALFCSQCCFCLQNEQLTLADVCGYLQDLMLTSELTDKPFFWHRVFVPLPVQVRLPFCSVQPQAASAAFSQLITDKAQLFDMYQLRAKQKPRPKSQITRGRRMPPYQPGSYQVPIGS